MAWTSAIVGSCTRTGARHGEPWLRHPNVPVECPASGVHRHGWKAGALAQVNKADSVAAIYSFVTFLLVSCRSNTSTS